MPEITVALTTYILAQTGITSLIDRRFFYDYLPQGTKYPAIVGLNISDVKLHTLTEQLPLEQPMIQFTAYAETKAEVQSIASQLKTALSDYQGTLSGIEVDYIKLANELSTVEILADGTTKINMIDLEYEVNFQRS